MSKTTIALWVLSTILASCAALSRLGENAITPEGQQALADAGRTLTAGTGWGEILFGAAGGTGVLGIIFSLVRGWSESRKNSRKRGEQWAAHESLAAEVTGLKRHVDTLEARRGKS